jgi:hypothetical protein
MHEHGRKTWEMRLPSVRAARSVLFLGLVVPGSFAQNNSNVTGSSTANGQCGEAAVGSNVTILQYCVIVTEPERQSGPITIRLTAKQFDALADLVADRVFNKLVEWYGNRSNEPTFNQEPWQASSSATTALFAGPLTSDIKTADPYNFQSPLSSPHFTADASSSSNSGFGVPGLSGTQPPPWTSILGIDANATQVTPLAGLTSETGLIKIDSDGLRNDFARIILKTDNLATESSATGVAGTLEVGIDGSLTLTGKSGQAISFPPQDSKVSGLLTFTTPFQSFGGKTEEEDPPGSLRVGPDGVVEVNGAVLKTNRQEITQGFSPIETNPSPLGWNISSVTPPQDSEKGRSLTPLSAPMWSCFTGSQFYVSPDGVISQCQQQQSVGEVVTPPK